MTYVIYKGKSESERIRDRLGNVHGKLNPNSVVETQPTRCVTSTYWNAGHIPVRKYPGPDEVIAYVSSKGGIVK
jgi:hypothetical protein